MIRMADDDTGTAGAGAEKTFTQADVDRIVRDRLAREREKFADYDDLKAKAAGADKDKSALEKLTEQVKALSDRAEKAERLALRADVAQAKGLTAAQAKRLQGTTREELEADADELLAMFKPAGKSADTESGKGGETSQSEGAGSAGGEQEEQSTKDGGKGGEGRKLPASGRPKEKLTAGAVPATTGDKTPAQLAEEILKSDF